MVDGTAVDGVISFGPLIEYLIGIVIVVVGGAASWALKKLSDKFGIEVSKEMDAVISEAIERSIGYAGERLKERGKTISVGTKNELLEEASEYVIQGVPKALRNFGLGKDDVKRMIESRFAGQLPDDESGKVEKANDLVQ